LLQLRLALSCKEQSPGDHGGAVHSVTLLSP